MASPSSCMTQLMSTFSFSFMAPSLPRSPKTRDSPLFPRVDRLPGEVGGYDLCLADRIHRAGEEVGVQDREVGQLPFFERAAFGVEAEDIGVVDGVEADGLLAAQ